MKTHREDDIIAALNRCGAFLDRGRFVEELRAARLDRLIRENQAKQKAELAQIKKPLDGSATAWAIHMAAQAELTKLFAENDRLSMELFG
jgi:hypothetical protein